MIFLDSARLADAQWAARQGWLAGLTMNPRLLAVADEDGAPLEHLRRLLEAFPAGTVCYQVTTLNAGAVEAEGRAAWQLDRQRLVVKVPSLPALLPSVVALQRDGISCMVTGVVSPGQVLAALAAGAEWIAVYVDRARRSVGEGGRLVERARGLIDRWAAPTRIAAAGLVDADQAVAAVRDGAHALTLPRDILEGLAGHPLTTSVSAEMVDALTVPNGRERHHVVERSTESR